MVRIKPGRCIITLYIHSLCDVTKLLDKSPTSNVNKYLLQSGRIWQDVGRGVVGGLGSHQCFYFSKIKTMIHFIILNSLKAGHTLYTLLPLRSKYYIVETPNPVPTIQNPALLWNPRGIVRTFFNFKYSAVSLCWEKLPHKLPHILFILFIEQKYTAVLFLTLVLLNFPCYLQWQVSNNSDYTIFKQSTIGFLSTSTWQSYPNTGTSIRVYFLYF